MKVAAIIDQYTVAVTRDPGDDPLTGEILTISGILITDPETGEDLGLLPGLRVKIADVHPRFLLAETYRIVTRTTVDGILRNRLADETPETVTVNIGDIVTRWRD